MVAPENRSYYSYKSNFNLSLLPNESATIVFQYNSQGPVEIGWDLSSLKEFIQDEKNNSLFINIFLGFILAMFFYKAFIYFHLKDKEYLIYAAMMLCVFTSQLAIHGVMHLYLFDYLNTFLITLLNWISVHLFLVLLWVFTFYFFNINKKSKFYYPLLFVIIYNTIITILYTASFFYADILEITPMVSNIAFLESFLLLFFTGSMIYQKKPGAILFFSAHISYIASTIMYILLLTGSLALNNFTMHSLELGMLAMILMMSLALSRKFKSIKEENEKQKQLIEINKQFTMIGTTISYVAHQWKQPLSILGSYTNQLLTQSVFEPNTTIKDIKPKIQNIENNIQYLNETLNSIKKLFKTSTPEEKEFTIQNIFDDLRSNFQKGIEKNNIELKLKVINNFEIKGEYNLLIHAISNLIQNSIEQFEIDQEVKQITIEADNQEYKTIRVKDNAGGISSDIINNLFESNITTKTFGTGIGLIFCKNIIEAKFNGKITVKNIDNGAEFIIFLIKNNTNTRVCRKILC